MSEIKVERPTQEKLKSLGIEHWSKWECEPSVFDWQYSGNETAYVFEGHVIVETASGKTEIKGGDLVHFPDGLKCKWHVKEKIKKVYTFK
jgi:hypothetical protein